jgi:hypothetical protein
MRPRSSGRSPFLILGAFLICGCVTNTPRPGPGDGRSVFVHPRTGEVVHGEKPTFLSGAGGLIPESRYADGKTEAAGAGGRAERRGAVTAMSLDVEMRSPSVMPWVRIQHAVLAVLPAGLRVVT